MTEQTSVTLLEGDNREHLKRLIADGVRVHSVVTDPPYGLVSITKRFGKDGAAPAKFGTDGAFARTGAGFMGSQWDGTGIERDPEFWRLIWEILLPGGYCLAFSGARTGHWQACAMEQAGFIMHPMTGWCFGSGFPKAHDAAKAIDKLLGKEGAVIPVGDPVRRMVPGATQHATGQWEKPEDRRYQPGDYDPATAAAAAAWQGWAYGAQTLKPALEPIYIGQKPFSEKTGAANLLKHGVGAFNLDGCRVACESGGRPALEVASLREDVKYTGTSLSGRVDGSLQSSKAVGTTELGRHPATLIHDGSDTVRALFPDSQGQIAKASISSDSRKTQLIYGAMARGNDNPFQPRTDADTSAARFFNAFPVEPEALYYHAKASTRDRVYQCQICDLRGIGEKPTCACLDENNKHQLRGHPTVKPVALMRHLVRLVTPPGGIVLDPFAGTGTTGAAARAEGFDCVLMEAEGTYCEDIRARLSLAAPPAASFDIEAMLGISLEPDIEFMLG